MALGVWVYLTLAGFLPPGLAVAYVLAATVALWRFGSTHLAWAIQALPYGAMIWVSWWSAPILGWLLLAWIGLVLVATWPRFPRHTLPEFLKGMRDLWSHR